MVIQTLTYDPAPRAPSNSEGDICPPAADNQSETPTVVETDSRVSRLQAVLTDRLVVRTLRGFKARAAHVIFDTVQDYLLERRYSERAQQVADAIENGPYHHEFATKLEEEYGYGNLLSVIGRLDPSLIDSVEEAKPVDLEILRARVKAMILTLEASFQDAESHSDEPQSSVLIA